MNSKSTYTNTKTTLTRILHERELWKGRFICLLCTKTAAGFDITLKLYGRNADKEEFCEVHFHKYPNFIF